MPAGLFHGFVSCRLDVAGSRKERSVLYGPLVIILSICVVGALERGMSEGATTLRELPAKF